MLTKLFFCHVETFSFELALLLLLFAIDARCSALLLSDVKDVVVVVSLDDDDDDDADVGAATTAFEVRFLWCTI